MYLNLVRGVLVETLSEFLMCFPFIEEELISTQLHLLRVVGEEHGYSDKDMKLLNTDVKDVLKSDELKEQVINFIGENTYLDELIEFYQDDIKQGYDAVVIDFDVPYRINIYDLDFGHKDDYVEFIGKIRSKFKEFHCDESTDEAIIQKAVEYELEVKNDT